MTTSPFPGMDPYLESYLWGDAHSRLANEISDRLAPLIEPHYVARLATRLVKGYLEPGEITVLYPDVEVVRSPRPASAPPGPSTASATITPPTLVLSAPLLVETPVTSVEIRDVAGNTLVTAVEILSPVNKRAPGLSEYQAKREAVLSANAHLLEIDLLRRGKRPLAPHDLPPTPYFVFLTRASRPYRVETWAIRLQDSLPVIPVPLHPPDDDVALDLGAALRAIYARGRYGLSIDYSQPPDPPLDDDDARWAAELLVTHG